MVCTYHILFVHLSTDGHLSCFHLLIPVNNVATDTGMQVSAPVFSPFGYISRSKTARSYVQLFEELLNLFPSSCTILHPCHQYTSVLTSPHPLQHLLFPIFCFCSCFCIGTSVISLQIAHLPAQLATQLSFHTVSSAHLFYPSSPRIDPSLGLSHMKILIFNYL